MIWPHRQSGEDFADRPVIEATFPAIAAVVVDLQSFVAQRFFAEQQISSPDIGRRCRITPNVFRVRLQRLLGYEMFEIKAFLRKETTAGTAHQQLIAGNVRNVVREIAAHFVPQPFFNGRLHHLRQSLVSPRTPCPIHSAISLLAGVAHDEEGRPATGDPWRVCCPQVPPEKIPFTNH
jgi:hypothetical protein